MEHGLRMRDAQNARNEDAPCGLHTMGVRSAHHGCKQGARYGHREVRGRRKRDARQRGHCDVRRGLRCSSGSCEEPLQVLRGSRGVLGCENQRKDRQSSWRRIEVQSSWPGDRRLVSCS